MIGYSKASFVLWMLQNGSSCTHTWQVEDDTFFTGPWSTLFDAHMAHSADLIAVTQATQLTWPHDSNCFVRRNQTHTDTGTRCRQAGQLLMVVWPLLRMSHRLASEISRVLIDERAKGFHEALVAPVCERAMWCHIAPLSVAHVGRLVSGHSQETPKGARPTLELQARLAGGVAYDASAQPQANRIYHPVKCEADPGLGIKARRWAGGSAAAPGAAAGAAALQPVVLPSGIAFKAV